MLTPRSHHTTLHSNQLRERERIEWPPAERERERERERREWPPAEREREERVHNNQPVVGCIRTNNDEQTNGR